MINQITNILTNPAFVRFAQNTKATVTTESLFKATGRPIFILKDDSIDDKTKKYTATKEAVYQLLCLGIYLGMVGPVFKKLEANRENWAMNDEYVFPGSIQYWGPSSVCDITTQTLKLETEAK